MCLRRLRTLRLSSSLIALTSGDHQRPVRFACARIETTSRRWRWRRPAGRCWRRATRTGPAGAPRSMADANRQSPSTERFSGSSCHPARASSSCATDLLNSNSDCGSAPLPSLRFSSQVLAQSSGSGRSGRESRLWRLSGSNQRISRPDRHNVLRFNG